MASFRNIFNNSIVEYRSEQQWLSSVTYLTAHITVVCLLTWPLSGNEACIDFVLIQTSRFSCKNLVLMLAARFAFSYQKH